MIRITRYDRDGKLFHTCLTEKVEQLCVDDDGRIVIEMPMRFWRMIPGGRIEIRYLSEVTR